MPGRQGLLSCWQKGGQRRRQERLQPLHWQDGALTLQARKQQQQQQQCWQRGCESECAQHAREGQSS